MDTRYVVDRILDLAAREPDRPALRVEGARLGYGELAAAATRVGDFLRGNGLGPEDVVATALPRGGDSVIAVLGIWMCGASYLPTDLKWPRHRSESLLAEAAACVLEQAADGEVAQCATPTGPGLRLREVAAIPRLRSPAIGPTARNLAYVLYTSGSTGRPNAVGVEYGSLANYADYLRGLLHSSEDLDAGGIRVLLSADLCFDASLRPIVMLAAGAELYLAPDLDAGSWHDQVDYIRDNGITVLSGVTSWYSGLLSAGFAVDTTTVRLAFVGGEAVPNNLVRELATDKCALIVQYGPTETTVAASGARLVRDDFAEPPIGGEIPGARFHLLREDDLTPVAPGEPGSVFVGGPGVARGYLRNARLTAERFVPDPSGPAGARMFRTGDRARALPGGGYGFLGRLDDQVKIGGRRIEPGEISSVLNRHPGVAQSAVLLLTDGANPRLAACFVGLTAQIVPGLDQSVRDHLAGQLPDYLVPALIQQVERLPVTAHGKVDVAELGRRLESARGAAGGSGEPALDEDERRLVEIMQTVLGVPCTLDDDFFELGGGSLDALAILAQARQAFGVRVRLRDFFQARTMRGLHKLIKDSG